MGSEKWKVLFSHNPKIIYSVDSPCSGTINVWDDRGSLLLEVGGYPQSVSLNAPGLEKRYWSRAVDEVTKRLHSPKRGLVIGVGGATILHLLAQKFPNLELTGVEIDEKIIDIARKFFNLDKVPNFTVVTGDGAQYIRDCRDKKFDLIFVDAYLGGNYPSHFEKEKFIQEIKEILAPGGLVVFNRTSGSDFDAFGKLIKENFARLEKIKIPLPGFLGGLGGNFLFFCK